MIILKKALLFFTLVIMTFFVPTTQAIKSCDSNGTWEPFDIHTYVKTISENIEGLTFSSDGKFFSAIGRKDVFQHNIDFAYSEKTTLYVWNINYKNSQITIDTKLFYDDHFFSPEGNFLVACGQDDFLYVYALPSLTLIQTLDKKIENAYFLHEKFLFVSFQDSTSSLFYLDKQIFTEIKTFNNVNHIQISNQYSYKNSRVGVLSNDDSLEIFKMQPDYSLKKTDLSFDNVSSFSLIPHSDVLKVEYFDKNKNKYWDLSTKEEIDAFDDLTLFSPDGTLYAQIDKKKHELHVFEKNNPKELTMFTNIDKKQTNFSPGGRFLDILSNDGTLKIWNTQTRSISAIMNDVSSCTFLGCDIVVHIKTNNKKFHIFKFAPYQNFFDMKSSQNIPHPDKIKNFFSGQTPNKVTYANLNILFEDSSQQAARNLYS